MLVFAMLPPLLSFIVAGCIAFFLCAGMPSMRRFALGLLVWFVALGLMLPSAFLPNVALVGKLTEKHLHAHIPLNSAALTHVRELAFFNGEVVLALALLLALVHGFVLRRLPFAAFRVYASTVALAAAVASAWCVSVFAAVVAGSNLLGVSVGIILLTLIAAAPFVYRHAALFRGERPIRLQPVSTANYQHSSRG